MLLQFSVENFLSFRDKAILSAAPAPGVSHSPGQVLRDPHTGCEALRALVLYGANASGKSNLIKALRFAQEMVIGERGARASIPVRPFALDQEHANAPSQFEFEFLFEGERWSFGFAVTSQRVEAEWLFRRPAPPLAEVCVFEREAAEEGEGYTLEAGEGLAEADRPLAELIGRGTRANQLFVSEAEGRGIAILDTVVRWFRQGLGVFGPEIGSEAWLVERMKDERTRAFASELLERAGTGVGKVELSWQFEPGESTSAEERGFNKLYGLLAAEIWKSSRSMGEHVYSQSAFLHDMKKAGFREVVRLGALKIEAKLVDNFSFALSDESDGTVRLLYFAALLGVGSTEQPRQTTVCVDELDRSLHPNLSRFVLESLLNAPEEGAPQFIFTTHDTGLLDLGLVSRDAVWFTEKDRGGGTHLYSLAEFKPEQIEELAGDWERGYLRGRFGAVPFLGDPKRLGWGREPAGEPQG